MDGRRISPGSAVILLVLGLIAFGSFGRGIGDALYQLADLKEDPLYLRGPAFTVAAGVVLSLVLAGTVAFVRALLRRSPAARAPDRAGGERRGGGWPWWALLVAAWGGYALGGAVAVARGGPVDHPGTLHLGLGAPLDLAVDVPATCRSAPNRSDVIVRVSTATRGMEVIVRDQVTGGPRPYPEPTGVEVRAAYPPGGDGGIGAGRLPARPPTLQLSTGTRSGTASGQFVIAEPRSFLDAYSYVVTGSSGDGAHGSLRADAIRSYGLMVVDALVPDDPWPPRYELTATWTCDLSAVAPSGSGPGAAVHATIGTGAAGGATPARPTLAPAVDVPVELRLVTGLAEARVEISGGTIIDAAPPTIDGPATAAVADGVFWLTQGSGAAAAGGVVGATFRFRVRDLVPGSTLGVVFDGTPGGATVDAIAVTVSNTLGVVPVPVYAEVRTSSDLTGWRPEIPASLLAEPVDMEMAPPREPEGGVVGEVGVEPTRSSRSTGS